MQIYLLLTEKCNLSCSMCIRGKQSGADLSLKQIEELCSREHFENDDIVITGGEPTIHKEFVQIVRFLSEKANSVMVCTNGTTDYYIDSLRDIENLTYQISIDGMGKTHDTIRGTGMFKRTMKTVQLMEEKTVKYCVATVCSKKNKQSLNGLIDELSSLKNMLYWRVSYEMPFGNVNYSDMMTADEWNDLVDGIIRIAKFRVKIKKIFPFDLYEKNMSKMELASPKRRCFNCGSAKNKLYIYPNMNVYPCTCLSDFCIGNLSEMRLEDILNGSAIKAFVDYEIEKDSICMDCEYRKYCNGGCIGMSYHFYGKLGMGDARCPRHREQE